MEKIKELRHSEYGFHCGHCKKFVYNGYDDRDKKDLPNKNAVCENCDKFYEDKDK